MTKKDLLKVFKNFHEIEGYKYSSIIKEISFDINLSKEKNFFYLEIEEGRDFPTQIEMSSNPKNGDSFIDINYSSSSTSENIKNNFNRINATTFKTKEEFLNGLEEVYALSFLSTIENREINLENIKLVKELLVDNSNEKLNYEIDLNGENGFGYDSINIEIKEKDSTIKLISIAVDDDRDVIGIAMHNSIDISKETYVNGADYSSVSSMIIGLNDILNMVDIELKDVECKNNEFCNNEESIDSSNSFEEMN